MDAIKSKESTERTIILLASKSTRKNIFIGNLSKNTIFFFMFDILPIYVFPYAANIIKDLN